MKKLSVAVLVSQFPNVVQTYIVSAITGLQQNECTVTVVAGSAPAADAAKLVNTLPPDTPRNLIYINTEMPALLYHIFTLPVLRLSFWKHLFLVLSSDVRNNYGWKYLLKAIIRGKATAPCHFDIIHAHNVTLGYDYLFFKELYGTKIVTTFHGKEPQGSKTLASAKQIELFNKSDMFFVNTVFALNSLVDEGCPPAKIRILPQGTNIDLFHYKARSISEETINILTVGRLSIEKGQHIALKAISQSLNNHPKIVYHLVGNGPERANLKELIKSLCLEDNVIMHGYASSTELADIYSKAHIFILPSIDLHDGLHVETQGVVLQEAQASGLAVIASNAGGIPEVINDNKTGILFEAGNADHLALKLDMLLKDNDLYSSLSKNGRADVETVYNSEVISAKLRSYYDELLGN